MDVPLIQRPAVRTAGRLALLVAALGAKFAVCVPEVNCAEAMDGETAGIAVVICQREYQRHHVPETGARFANLLRWTGDSQGARALATELLLTDARADVLVLLARLAIDQGHTGEATDLLDRARSLHAEQREPDKLAIDDQFIATIFHRQGNFTDALRGVDSCIGEARDVVLKGFCHLTAGNYLAEIGYLEAGRHELESAGSLLTLDRDQAALAIELAELEQRYGLGPAHQDHSQQAVAHANRAIELARRSGSSHLARKAELNLAYSLAELGRTDEAATWLDKEEQLDLHSEDEIDRATLRARIAYRRGEHELAATMYARLYDKLDNDEQRLLACAVLGRIALAANNFELAATWAHRGIELVEHLRAAQSAIELRSWMLSSRRDPYEILFTARARAGRIPEALAAFDSWQGRTLLDAMARGRTEPLDSIRTAVMHTDQLQRLFPVLSKAPTMKPTGGDALVAALSGVDLVALVVAEGEIWRIASHAGRIDLVDLGPQEAMEPRIIEFQSKPTDPVRADPLGAALLGEDAFRETDQTLHVLLDGAFAALPIAALRRNGHPLISLRPMVRAARLSALDCVPGLAKPPRAIVIADAKGDLPQASREAIDVGRRFGVIPKLGAAATHAAVFAVPDADLLHLAVHASVELGGGALEVADDRVSALEIASQPTSPRLVVLSTCESAASEDGELAESLAMAFLASGSSQVIGTLRRVLDADAEEITSAFYRADGAADAVRALARVQASLAETSNTEWPNFAVFGHDTCRARAR